MANGLLDYIQDFDINKALGVQYGLPKGMLSPEIESQMGVGGTVAGIGNVIEGMQQGAGTPENIFRFLTGQKAGRQNVIDTAAKNYLSQLNIAKLQGDIAQDPYKLAKLKFEVEKAPYEVGELQNKFYQSSFKTQSIKDEFKKLQDEGRTDELNTLMANPDKYFELKQSTDINKMTYSQPELSAARILNLNVRDRKNWNEQDEINYNAIISAPSVEEAASLNAEALARHKADPNRVPYVYTPSRNEVIAKIRKQNKGQVVTNQVGQQQVVQQPYSTNELSNLPVGAFEGTGQGKYKDGGFKGADGKIYTNDEFNKLGLEQQNLLSLDVTREEYVESRKKLNEDMRTDRQSTSYAFKNSDRTARYLEKILDDPVKFKKLFSKFGRIRVKVNEVTGSVISEMGGEGQDIVNLLRTIKGQQFTNEIQDMRANNKTGGAVGNVSDREVEMFQNIAANLNYSGSAEQLWAELNDLYQSGFNMANRYRDNFKDFYGEDEFKRYRIGELSVAQQKDYFTDLNQALSQTQSDQAAKVFGVPRKKEQQPYTTNEGFSLAN
jgi:hypothetical protein